MAPQVTTINAGNSPYTALTTDWSLRCDTTAAGRTINLPAATNKLFLYFVNLGTNTCTITPNGTDTIYGVNASFTVNGTLASFALVSNGTNGWDLQ